MRDFRTYARAEAALGEGLTVVHGPNGAGKSNLLEAIYFGCTARPLRTRNERELIRFGATGDAGGDTLSAGEGRARAGGRLRAGAAEAHECGRRAGRAHARRPGAAAAERLHARSPGAREGCPPGSAAPTSTSSSPRCGRCARPDRREYSRVLVQRNALLRASAPGVHRRRRSRAGIASWRFDGDRAARGPRVARSRCVAEPFATRADALGLSGEAALEYRPRSTAPRWEEFLAELERAPGRRLERGFTAHGPHRDELVVHAGRPRPARVRITGRAAPGLLALLLAERDVLGRARPDRR